MSEQMLPELSENVAQLQRKVEQLNSRVMALEHVRQVRLRRLGILSTAKVVGFLYLLLGVLVEVVILLVGLLIPESEVGFSPLLPLVLGLLGFVLGLIGAWLYNLIAGFLGGFLIELG